MKHAKIFLLIGICILFLTGCGYSDTYNNHKSLQNLDCTYVAVDSGSGAYPNVGYTIRFTATSSAFSVSLNGTTAKSLVGSGASNILFGPQNYMLNFNSTDEWVSYLDSNNKCPSTMYMYVDQSTKGISPKTVCPTNSTGGASVCYQYNLQSDDTPGHTKTTSDTLTKSDVYSKYSGNLLKTVSIQFGYDSANQKSYVYIDGVETAIGSDKTLYYQISGYDYRFVMNEKDYDSIFNISNGKVTFPDDIKLGVDLDDITQLHLTNTADYENYDTGSVLHQTSAQVKVIWKDSAGKTTTSNLPVSDYTVKLIKKLGDTTTVVKNITLSSANGWFGEVDNLETIENGQSITYSFEAVTDITSKKYTATPTVKGVLTTFTITPIPGSGAGVSSNIDTKDTSISDVCSSPSYRKPMKFIGTIVQFLRYIVPIVIIGFGVMDLYKALTSDKDDGLKKAIKSIIIRVAAGVAIFLLPGIVQFTLNLVDDWKNNTDGNNYNGAWCCCTDCVLNATCDTSSCDSTSCRVEGTN